MKFSTLKNIISTCALLAYATFAQAEIKLSDHLPIGPQVQLGHLNNGLTYYIQKNAKPEKKLELRLVVKAGSVLEDDDQQGLAHFLEHMAFNGSTHFKKTELISYLQSIGVKFGADLNANTDVDQTIYILPIPTDKKENIETGFQVLEDWAHGIAFRDEDIDAERAIVLEESRSGKGAQDRMSRQLFPKLWNGSHYADRLPIGKEEVIKNFKYDAVRRFYRDWYRPDLMAVVVVGDIEPAAAEKLIRKHFSGLKNPAHERPREYTKIDARSESEALVITDKEATNDVVMIHYPAHQEKTTATFAEYREKMMQVLIGMMLAERTRELVQQSNPPFIAAGSGKGGVLQDYKAFSSVAVVGKAGVATAINALVQENERAGKFGFTAAELDRAKKNALRGIETAYNEREKSESGNFAAEYIRNFLVQETIPGIANEYRYTNELLPAITLDEVNHYAAKLMPADDEKKLVVFMGPAKDDASLPGKQDLLTFVAKAEKIEVKPNEEKVYGTSLMTPPQAGTIASEKFDQKLGLTELILGNGIKVILKSTDFKNDQVMMNSTRFGGQSLFDDKDLFNARYADSVVPQMGLKDYTPTDLQKVMVGKSISVALGLGFYDEGFNGSSSSADVETMLELVYLKLTQPRKDEDLYQSLISKWQDYTKNTMSQPEAVFGDAITSTLYNDHPRVAKTARPEDFDKINIDRVLGVYKQRFGSAKGMTFFFVGSFDLAKIKPLIATYLGSLPTGDIATTYRDLNIRPVSGVVKKEVYKGAEPKSTISINFTGDAKFSIEEQIRFYELIEVLNIKIIEALREKMGLIYGGGFSGSFEKIPYEHYAISLSLPTAPENVDKVIAAAFAEIQKIKDDGVLEADLNKVKLARNQGHKIAMRENNYWITHLWWSAVNGVNPATILTVEERNNAVTSGDLKDAAKRYFNMGNYVQVVLYPEKKATTASSEVKAVAK